MKAIRTAVPRVPVAQYDARRFMLLGLAVLLLGAAIINVMAFGAEEVDRGLIYLLNAILSVYLYVECRRHILRNDTLGLISPPLVASFLFFFLNFVFPVTASWWDPWIIFRIELWSETPARDLTTALGLSWLSAFCMWRGYELGGGAARLLRVAVAHSKFIRTESQTALLPLLAAQLVFFGLVGFTINLGVFGFAASVEAKASNVEILEFMNIGIAVGALSLMLLLMHYFGLVANKRQSLGVGIICLILVISHVGVGLLSGFKSQMVMPFATTALAHYLAMRKISVMYIAMSAIALFVAYQVIEPYRAYLGRSGLNGAVSVQDLVNSVQTSWDERASANPSDVPLPSQMASRFDLVFVTGMGVAAANSQKVDPEYIYKMEESIYLAPILAFVPRALWSGKPTYNTGGWFNRLVLGSYNDDETSVGMGPIAYLYFIGGVIGVAFGFICIGFLQALLFEGLARGGSGGLIVFLSVATSLFLIPTDIGPALTSILRIIPLAIIAQMVLLSPYKTRAVQRSLLSSR